MSEFPDRWPDDAAAKAEAPVVEEVVPPEPAVEAAPAPEPDDTGAGLAIPPDVDVLEGEAGPMRRGIAIVVSRAEPERTTQLLESALAELDATGVARSQLTVVPVPGPFELPLAAMALAKTRRYACVVALGSVTDGTPESALIASEAASGLQLAGLETGIPVGFGLVTGGEAAGRGAEAVRTALEMADLFQQLRQTAVAQ